MAQETNDGVSYLMALRRSSGTASTPATEPATAARPVVGAFGTEERFQGPEKRRSLRYKCEGSAEMRVDQCDVRTWSTFTDVSLHGCYIEAQATYPAGTVLHMKLEANGYRVETKGEVKVCYPYLGMGIAFAEMSPENLVQLKQLLNAVSRPAMIMGPGVASPVPSCGPLDGIPPIDDPAAAMRGLVEFFEGHNVMMRDDFLRILRKNQGTDTLGKVATP